MVTYDLVVIGTVRRDMSVPVPRRAAGHEGRGGREGRDRSRHLPNGRVHAVEGRSCTRRKCSRSRALVAKMGVSVSAPEARSSGDDEFQAAGSTATSKGVEFLMKKNKIDVISGRGRILAPARSGVGRRRQKRRSSRPGKKRHRHRHRLRTVFRRD